MTATFVSSPAPRRATTVFSKSKVFTFLKLSNPRRHVLRAVALRSQRQGVDVEVTIVTRLRG